jgi:ABC-type nitrate/sulfonate/bicarbonate transport system ATPase subunit
MTTPVQSERPAAPAPAWAAHPVIDATRLPKVFGVAQGSVPSRVRLARGKRSARAGQHLAAVDDVTFRVAPGEFFVIIGLSGSGKSTLLRMLNRLVEPTSGGLLVCGRDVASMTDGELRELRNRKVNMVFQHFALFPHRTVLENAAYGLHVRREPAAQRTERAEWALRMVWLADRADALPGELSGGMRQRAGLARALATDAEILLMDEPFSALDPLIRRVMQDLLQPRDARRPEDGDRREDGDRGDAVAAALGVHQVPDQAAGRPEGRVRPARQGPGDRRRGLRLQPPATSHVAAQVQAYLAAAGQPRSADQPEGRGAGTRGCQGVDRAAPATGQLLAQLTGQPQP